MRNGLAGFLRRTDGASSIEFAFVFPPLFLMILGLGDVAYAHYVRNTFESSVNETARAVYIEPDTTKGEMEGKLDAVLARFPGKKQRAVTEETVGGVKYWVLSASATYRYKVPPLSWTEVTLAASSRAPVLDYTVGGGLYAASGTTSGTTSGDDTTSKANGK